MSRIHNIISAIPHTKQTDPNAFPPYEYREFPKMLLMKDGTNVLDSQGQPKVFEDEEELELYLDANPDIAGKVVEPRKTALQVLDEENDVIRKLLAENEALKKRIKNEEDETPKRRIKVDEATDEDEAKAARIARNRRRSKKKRAGPELKTLRN